MLGSEWDCYTTPLSHLELRGLTEVGRRITVRSIAHMNSQGLAQHAQDLDKNKPAEHLRGQDGSHKGSALAEDLLATYGFWGRLHFL